jgi:thiamine-monophosphate kinase
MDVVKHNPPRAGEWQLTERIRNRVELPPGTRVLHGIGDDCAIYRPRGAVRDLLFTTDLLVENTHFRRATHRPQDVGWKALARGLSDIAAMGGEPRFCLVSLSLAAWTDRKWVDGFYGGLLRLAAREKCPLIGGDLSHGRMLACDMVVAGDVPRGAALLRSGARPGDAIYVSGVLGGSALGRARQRGEAWKRHLRPEPRLALGRFLRSRIGATSAMDLSDGISLDLRRLCLASGLSAAIEAPPRFAGASADQSLHGGEDYELLFTVRPRQNVPAEFQGIPLTRIGRMVPSRGDDRVRFRGEPLVAAGYDHFNPGSSE